MMTKYLNKFEIISPNQFGFQKGKSTCTIYTLTDHIYSNLNMKKHSVAILIDLCKDYDTVDHSILLLKLSRYGFRGDVLKWFKSY